MKNVLSKFGTPDSRPPLSSVIPSGSEPPVTANVNGGVVPVAVICWLYGVPICPTGRVEGERVLPPQPTAIRYHCSAEQPLPSIHWTLKSNTPWVVVVPEITPSRDMVIPGGYVPTGRKNVNGGLPPSPAST